MASLRNTGVCSVIHSYYQCRLLKILTQFNVSTLIMLPWKKNSQINLRVMCCIFGQCFSSSMTGGFFFFLIYMYPELSSYRIVFCLRLYRISDPCLTSVRYHQISLDVVLWKYLHRPLSFLQTPEPLVFFTFPAQHIKWTNHFVNFFYFIFLRTCILSLHWRKLIINDGLFNSTIRSNKYLQDFPFKHKCIWNKSKKT